MKPKAPKKKDTKPSAKSGEVRENKNFRNGYVFCRVVYSGQDETNQFCYNVKLQYSNDGKTWVD